MRKKKKKTTTNKQKSKEKEKRKICNKFVSRNAQETVKERLTGDKWPTYTNGAVEHAARVDEQQQQQQQQWGGDERERGEALLAIVIGLL